MRLPPLIGLTLSTVAAVGLAACSSSNHIWSASSSAPVAPKGSQPPGSSNGSAQNGGNYQLPTAVTSLRIAGDAVAIDVTAQDRPGVITVREQLHGKATTTKDVTGSSATLTAKCPPGFHFGVDCSTDYTVTMPARVALDVDTPAADVHLTGPFANATISTHASRVIGTALGAGAYQVTTNAGDVALTFAVPPDLVRVKSDVGRVKLTVPGGTRYAVSTDTTLGVANVQVDRDSSSTHRLDLSTTVGAITVDKG